jgi:hypothetical protein
MTKLTKDTPEYAQEWAKMVQITEALKLAPNNVELKAALLESAEKLGAVVPIEP